MLYKKTKIKVRSPDGETGFFDIAADVLQRNTLAPYKFIICLDYVLRMSIDIMKANSFTLEKARRRRYTAWIIIDADYTDDIALLAKYSVELHSLEKTAGAIGLRVNAEKIEYMCFNQNQRGDISIQKGDTRGQIHLPQKQCPINPE